MKKLAFIGLVLSAGLTACGGGEKPATTAAEPAQEVKVEPAKTCTYNYEGESTEVLWVAYKYTEKVGVKGVFDEFTVDGVSEAQSPSDVVTGATFSIMTESVNSGDPTRDPKIREQFFGSMENGETITGKVVSASGDEMSGDIAIELTMNGATKVIEGAYTYENDVFEVEADISVNTWNAQAGLAALNEVCEDLHKGADGVSILWPDVKLYISTKLAKACN